MAEDKATGPQTKSQPERSKLIIGISVAIAIVAIVAIAFVLIGTPKHVKTQTLTVKMNEKVAKAAQPVTVGTPTYVLKFEELKGVKSAIPLTYPDPNGVVFISVRTANMTNEVWTFKDGNLVGRFKLNGTVVPVFDVRKGEYATYKGKLLVGINGVLYAIYGDKAEKLARYDVVKGAKIGIFTVKEEAYAWLVKVNKNVNDTTVYCALFDLFKNKELANYTFDLGANVSAANPLPDLLDGKGCLVLWMKTASPIMYYVYKGENGEAKGKVDLMKMRVATFAPIFFEVAPYESKPYFILITPNPNGRTFELRLHDVLDNETTTFTLPGIYNFVNIGDYFGNGYVGDALFLVYSNEGVKMEIFDVNGKYQEINVGKLNRELAVFNGIMFKPQNKRAFGLGNFTNASMKIITNVGTLKFKVENVPQNVSSLFIVGSLDNSKLCYTAIINPAVGGLRSPQMLVQGKVYMAVGCSG